MLGDQDIKNLIQQQLETTVQNYVASVLEQQEWQGQFERNIQQHLQDRITAKFANISTVPELQTAIEQGIMNLFDQQRLPHLHNLLDQDHVRDQVQRTAESMVRSVADTLTLDLTWLARIEAALHQAMTDRMLQHISAIDLDSLIVNAIDNGIVRWQDRMLSELRTKGVTDMANQCELTILDGAVVVTTAMATPGILVEREAEIQGSLKTRDLIVTGRVNVDCESWSELAEYSADLVRHSLDQEWTEDLVTKVLDRSRESGIEFASVNIKGQPLIDSNRLNSAITESSLVTVGPLRELRVVGKTRLADTVHVEHKRVGINTMEPDSALSIWDEEVNISLGKHSQDTAFLGTGRKQRLALGVNRRCDLVIDDQGLVTVKDLRVDRWRISHSDVVPGWSGTKGDLVLNSSPSERAPFAWSCLGGFRWMELWAQRCK